MNIKTILSTLFFLIVGTLITFADETILQGAQVTQESDLVSGKPYILYYVGNKTGCYVKAKENNFQINEDTDKDITNEAIYYFVSNGNGTWKIQSQKTGKYFPVPNGTTTFSPVNESDAGSWTLYFLQDGTIAPYSGNYCLNRSDGILHSNEKGSNFPQNVNQLKIYELGFTGGDTKVYTVKDKDNHGVANISNSWAFASTGFANYYYMYNTVAKQFAYPTANGEWTLSEAAVPVSVNYHSIISKDGVTFKIGTETNLKIEETSGTVVTSELEAALDNLLVYNTSKITAPSGIETVTYSVDDGVETITDHNDGWYAIRIHKDDNNPLYDGNFLYTLATENQAYGRPHPMSHGGSDYPKHPAADDATYYVRLWPVTRGNDTYYHWQVPSGKFVVNHNNDYPITWIRPASDFVIEQNTDNTFYIQSSGFRTKAFDGYIGKTAHKNIDSPTRLDIYKVDPSAQNLTAWRVVFNEGADDVKLHCTRGDVHGLTDVYNHGYFFLPSSEPPVSADFLTPNEDGFVGSAEVRESDHTIRVVYAPGTCFTEDDITVVQGSRTTGKGNQMQALLRIEVKPQAPCYPKQFIVSLTGSAQLDRVQAYMTSSEQLRAEGSTPILLGTQETLADGTVTISVDNVETSSHLMRMGESTYIWITADIKSTASESANVDASISQIQYQNQAASNPPCNITTKGNPDGDMRIFLRQSDLWVSTEDSGAQTSSIERYYRNPVILKDGDNLLAFCEYRYDNVNGLGKDYDGSNYGHCIDVVMRKSEDNGQTWGDAVTIAAGTEGATPSGYAGPAVAMSGSNIICLMAKGSTAYDSSEGLTQVAISTSTDGSTWTTPSELSIEWSTLSPTSFYVTPGKGVTYSDGHVAFVINAKVGGKLQEHLLYSDAACTSWTVDPTPLSGKGKDSKLEVKNDGSLYVTGNQPLSIDCNNDVLYFGRSTQGQNIRDAVLHTVIWRNSPLRELRLYVSFDQMDTWKEMFTITPANAATSSIQKLADGNFAIFFEDGSIGNNEKDGCYTLNCAVISKEMMEAQMTDLYTATAVTLGSKSIDITKIGSGWATEVRTTGNSGYGGIVISTTYSALDLANAASQRNLCIKPSATGATDEITITAPDGYIIKGFSIGGFYKNASETYVLSSDYNDQTVSLNTSSGIPELMTVDNVYYKTAKFKLSNNNSSNNYYALISDLRIELAQEYSVTLHQVNGAGSKSYATLYVPMDLRQTDSDTKAYYITEVTAEGIAKLTETEGNGKKIAHNTAVVLINSVGSEHASFAVTSGLVQPVDESVNLLKGTLTGTTIDLSNTSNNYSLGKRRVDGGEWVAGFYQNGNASYALGANRAYLVTNSIPPAQSLSRGFDIPWSSDDNTTSIAEEPRVVPDKIIETPYYTLDGRQVNGKPTTKGIYIKNRQKVVIK